MSRSRGDQATALKLSVATIAVVIAFGAASTASAHDVYQWPTVQKQAFIANCLRTSGGKAAVCHCALDWLQRRYSYSRIAAMYLTNRRATVLVLTKAALACQ